jgi:hypothetical protein
VPVWVNQLLLMCIQHSCSFPRKYLVLPLSQGPCPSAATTNVIHKKNLLHTAPSKTPGEIFKVYPQKFLCIHPIPSQDNCQGNSSYPTKEQCDPLPYEVLRMMSIHFPNSLASVSCSSSLFLSSSDVSCIALKAELADSRRHSYAC